MDEGTIGRLRVVAGVLALVVAGIHLLHPSQGGHALLAYARVGYLGDPRPLLFTLGGFALVFGVVAGYNGVGGRLLYLGGIAVALAFLFGYGVWHTALGHGGFWPHIESHGHTDANAIVVVFRHLAVERLALVSKLAELALVSCLVALYLIEARQV